MKLTNPKFLSGKWTDKERLWAIGILSLREKCDPQVYRNVGNSHKYMEVICSISQQTPEFLQSNKESIEPLLAKSVQYLERIMECPATP